MGSKCMKAQPITMNLDDDKNAIAYQKFCIFQYNIYQHALSEMNRELELLNCYHLQKYKKLVQFYENNKIVLCKPYREVPTIIKKIIIECLKEKYPSKELEESIKNYIFIATNFSLVENSALESSLSDPSLTCWDIIQVLIQFHCYKALMMIKKELNVIIDKSYNKGKAHECVHETHLFKCENVNNSPIIEKSICKEEYFRNQKSYSNTKISLLCLFTPKTSNEIFTELKRIFLNEDPIFELKFYTDFEIKTFPQAKALIKTFNYILIIVNQDLMNLLKCTNSLTTEIHIIKTVIMDNIIRKQCRQLIPFLYNVRLSSSDLIEYPFLEFSFSWNERDDLYDILVELNLKDCQQLGTLQCPKKF